MQYTREQLEQMPDHQLCAAVHKMTGILIHLDGDGMLRLMEHVRCQQLEIGIESVGPNGWEAFILNPWDDARPSWRFQNTSAPRAIAIAALLAGEDCK